MYASLTSTSTSSVVRSAIVTTAPRVSPPPTDGATTSPTSASLRSTVPVNGARITVFSRLASAKRRRRVRSLDPRFRRLRAGRRLRGPHLHRVHFLFRDESRFSARMSRNRRTSRARTSRCARASTSSALAVREVRVGLRRPEPDSRRSPAGRSRRRPARRPFAHSQVGDAARELGRHRRPRTGDHVPVGRNAGAAAAPPAVPAVEAATATSTGVARRARSARVAPPRSTKAASASATFRPKARRRLGEGTSRLIRSFERSGVGEVIGPNDTAGPREVRSGSLRRPPPWLIPGADRQPCGPSSAAGTGR